MLRMHLHCEYHFFGVLCRVTLIRVFMISLFPARGLSTPKFESLKLVHPRTGSPASFLLDRPQRRYVDCLFLDHLCRLYETQSVVRGQQSNGSFLLASPGSLLGNTDLAVYTEIDPFFILLDPLMAACTAEGPFVDYIDCMNIIIENSSGQMVTLVQALNASPNFRSSLINNFCDHKNVLDRDMVRFNRDKLLIWLKQKVDRVTSYVLTSDLYLVEVAGNPAELAKITALELIRSYVSDSVYEDLVSAIGFNTDSVFAVQTAPSVEQTENDGPKNGPVKRPQPGQSFSQPSAKKQKDAAIAKSCMKMTSFFKPK